MPMPRRTLRLWSMMMVCVLVGAPGAAGSQDLTAARACAGIADKGARLACYDAVFAPTAAPGAAPNIAVAAVVAAPPAASTAAGSATAAASAPAAAQFGDNGQLRPQPKANLPKKLDLKVQTVAPLGKGLYRLTLENGQVWETRQADWTLDFKSGDTVTISRMLLDAYQISLAGRGRSVGVKRIQ
jgi:hypothetical protein